MLCLALRGPHLPSAHPAARPAAGTAALAQPLARLPGNGKSSEGRPPTVCNAYTFTASLALLKLIHNSGPEALLRAEENNREVCFGKTQSSQRLKQKASERLAGKPASERTAESDRSIR